MFMLFLTLGAACVLVALVLPRTLWGSRGGLSLAGIAFFGALAALCAGCASTTITEYDAQGNVTKVTESDESAMAIAAQSITTKDNMLHASGWAVGVQPSAGSQALVYMALAHLTCLQVLLTPKREPQTRQATRR